MNLFKESYRNIVAPFSSILSVVGYWFEHSNYFGINGLQLSKNIENTGKDIKIARSKGSRIDLILSSVFRFVIQQEI